MKYTAELDRELHAKHNPEGSMLRNYQLRLLKLLKDFDALCRENGLRYWLSSGTLLGAVRHGGFIPWDDDIDVEMPWDDYVKLMKVFREDDDHILDTLQNDFYSQSNFGKYKDKHSTIEEHGSGDTKHKYKAPT